MSLDGSVGPVGGLPQKTIAVQNAGATVFFVPAGGNYHAADEWVSIPDVIATAEILRQTVVALLGAPVASAQ